MFGIGWGEVLVAGLAALLILGPDKLPEAARTAGQVYGRLHRFMVEARAALGAEIDMAEIDSAGRRRPRPASPAAAPEPPETQGPRA